MVNVKRHKTASDSPAPGVINKFTQSLMSLYHDVVELRLKKAQVEATGKGLTEKDDEWPRRLFRTNNPNINTAPGVDAAEQERMLYDSQPFFVTSTFHDVKSGDMYKLYDQIAKHDPAVESK